MLQIVVIHYLLIHNKNIVHKIQEQIPFRLKLAPIFKHIGHQYTESVPFSPEFVPI